MAAIRFPAAGSRRRPARLLKTFFTLTTHMAITHAVRASDREPLAVYVTANTVEEAMHIADRINAAPDYRVCGYATTREQMEQAFASSLQIDVLVTDIVLNGEDVTNLMTTVRKVGERVDILVYTTVTKDAAVIRAVLAGAMGYILKGDQEDLVSSMRLIRGGGSPVSPMVARSVLKALQARSLTPAGRARRPNSDAPLSGRETEILTLLAKGISFSEIGDILSISPHTVTAHIKKIYRKLQVHSRGEAVYEATIMGLLPGQRPISSTPPAN